MYSMFTLEAPFLTPASVEENHAIDSISGDSISGIDHGYFQREFDFSLLYQYCNGENHAISGSLQALGVAESEILFVNRLLVVDTKSRTSAAAALMDPWFFQALYNLDPPPRGDRYSGSQEHNEILIEAAGHGRMDLVYTLLSAGADVRWTDNMENTALHVCAMNGHHDVVKVLLEHGAVLGVENLKRETALHMAASSGHEAIVRLLLEKGASLNAVNSSYHTALHLASSSNHQAVVRLLLEKGADLSAATYHSKSTALHLAASSGHEAVLGLLLGRGADINVADRRGRTALHLAVSPSRGYEGVVRHLVKEGADLSAVENPDGPHYIWLFA